MLDIKYIDDEVYPVEASESGDNAYYLRGCEAIGSGRPNYASCLAKCKARKTGRLDERYSDCSAAIGNKRCPALAMRKEELDKGVAIYFVSRPKMQMFNDYRLRAERDAWAKLQTTGKRSRKPTEDYEPEATPDDLAPFNPGAVKGFQRTKPASSGVGSYEEVINAEIARLNSENSQPEARSEVFTAEPRKPATDDYGANLAALVSAEAEKESTTERPAMLPGESPLAYARRINSMNEA